MSNRATPRSLDENAVIRRLSLVSLIGNALLSGFKLLAGVWGHSGAMISDAIHSFSDVLTTFIAWFGVKVSRRAADASHPYGHERLECVASLFLGIVLMGTGIGVGRAGLETIFSGQYETITPPGAIALVAAVLSIVSKEAMYWYTRYYAKLIHSDAFMADAWHHRSDAFSSIGSLIGIGGAMLGFPVMDSVASVVICVFILKVAYDILKDAVVKMLDTSCGGTVRSGTPEVCQRAEGRGLCGYPPFPHVRQQGVCRPGNRGGRQQDAAGSPRRGRESAYRTGTPLPRHQACGGPSEPGGINNQK